MNESPLTYAIGDVHGHLDKVRAVLELCRRHANGNDHKIVFVGDYVDRGPDSRGVVELLMGLQQNWPNQVHCLRGNHELEMIRAAAGADESPWRAAGGDQTLMSYGIRCATELPRSHVEWLDSLPLCHDDGLRYFAHAGINPEKSLLEQHEDDLLWIREPFLSDSREYGRLIVHGHTPVHDRMADLRSNRLNLDSGAGYGGPLSAAAFDMKEVKPIVIFTHASDPAAMAPRTARSSRMPKRGLTRLEQQQNSI